MDGDGTPIPWDDEEEYEAYRNDCAGGPAAAGTRAASPLPHTKPTDSAFFAESTDPRLCTGCLPEWGLLGERGWPYCLGCYLPGGGDFDGDRVGVGAAIWCGSRCDSAPLPVPPHPGRWCGPCRLPWESVSVALFATSVPGGASPPLSSLRWLPGPTAVMESLYTWPKLWDMATRYLSTSV